MSSVIVAKASVILAFKFVISETCVKNILSLTYPHKKKSTGVISGDYGGQGFGPSLPIHLFGNVASKTDEHVNPSMEVHRLVGKLSIAETFLTEVQREVPTCPGKHLFVIRKRLYRWSVFDDVPPFTGLIGWRSVVELRRLRLVLMRVELECGDLVCCRSGR